MLFAPQVRGGSRMDIHDRYRTILVRVRASIIPYRTYDTREWIHCTIRDFIRWAYRERHRAASGVGSLGSHPPFPHSRFSQVFASCPLVFPLSHSSLLVRVLAASATSCVRVLVPTAVSRAALYEYEYADVVLPMRLTCDVSRVPPDDAIVPSRPVV